MNSGVVLSTFVASGAGASVRSSASVTGTDFADVSRAAGMIEGPLAATVKGLSAQLVRTVGGVNDTIGVARLETAMLDFAREAKALRIGNPGVAEPTINEALAAGAANAAALPAVGLNALDHATAAFAEAARSLAAMSAAPLYDPAPNTRT